MTNRVAVDINEVASAVTVRIGVTGIRRFNLRSRIGVALIGLGARVLPVTVCVAIEGPTLTRETIETGAVDGWLTHEYGLAEGENHGNQPFSRGDAPDQHA